MIFVEFPGYLNIFFIYVNNHIHKIESDITISVITVQENYTSLCISDCINMQLNYFRPFISYIRFYMCLNYQNLLSSYQAPLFSYKRMQAHGCCCIPMFDNNNQSAIRVQGYWPLVIVCCFPVRSSCVHRNVDALPIGI